MYPTSDCFSAMPHLSRVSKQGGGFQLSVECLKGWKARSNIKERQCQLAKCSFSFLNKEVTSTRNHETFHKGVLFVSFFDTAA